MSQTAESAPNHPALAPLKSAFPAVKLQATAFRGQVTVTVPAANVHDVLRFLRDDPSCDYGMLLDVGGVDYLGYPAPQPGRFAVVYHLVSLRTNTRLRVKSFLSPSLDTTGIADDPTLYLDSAADLWPAAEWAEREVFDMFGIRFRGHPDLRRILMWKDYPAHPLRKDYPLRGRGEREHYQRLTREAAP
ncbi:MAG: NADH-quinone oxidoreductase subunit C [Planctomycetes bacterium]|nr:NADH-quinone oxidoreductase subunit C [Planctomycetota bacterium]